MDAAACIGCGACVAACPNGAAQLFTAAKLQHLNLLPQGQPSGGSGTNMVDTMEEYFGSCTIHGECQEACPKEISVDFIAYMNRDYIKAQVKNAACSPRARRRAGGVVLLIGREDDLAHLRPGRAGRRRRIVTITGPGGVGKTRLASEWAAPAGNVAGGARVVSLAEDDADGDTTPARAVGRLGFGRSTPSG